jgi:uncharacterized protein YjlB
MAVQTLAGQIVNRLVKDNGIFPSNGRLPVLAYHEVLKLPAGDAARGVEKLFDSHSWRGSWRNGIFSYHHYHSTAHEALGVYRGSARVQLGGPTGPEFEVQREDVIAIPAVVAHKNLGSSLDFRVVGAYPAGQRYDMNYGKANERPRADRNIANVTLPELDPVFGDTGPLFWLWSS